MKINANIEHYKKKKSIKVTIEYDESSFSEKEFALAIGTYWKVLSKEDPKEALDALIKDNTGFIIDESFNRSWFKSLITNSKAKISSIFKIKKPPTN